LHTRRRQGINQERKRAVRSIGVGGRTQKGVLKRGADKSSLARLGGVCRKDWSETEWAGKIDQGLKNEEGGGGTEHVYAPPPSWGGKRRGLERKNWGLLLTKLDGREISGETLAKKEGGRELSRPTAFLSKKTIKRCSGRRV